MLGHASDCLEDHVTTGKLRHYMRGKLPNFRSTFSRGLRKAASAKALSPSHLANSSCSKPDTHLPALHGQQRLLMVVGCLIDIRLGCCELTSCSCSGIPQCSLQASTHRCILLLDYYAFIFLVRCCIASINCKVIKHLYDQIRKLSFSGCH